MSVNLEAMYQSIHTEIFLLFKGFSFSPNV